MSRINGTELTEEVAGALAKELQRKGLDERNLVEHVCNRFRIKKPEAERIVAAYKQGLSSTFDQQTGEPEYDGEYAELFFAARRTRGTGNLQGVANEQGPGKSEPSESVLSDDEIRHFDENRELYAGAIYAYKNELSSRIFILVFIMAIAFWLTDMKGVNALVVAAVAGLPWFVIMMHEGTAIESFIVFIIIMFAAIWVSYAAGNGFPWTSFVLGFLAARTAPIGRERRNAQQFLNVYGIEEFKQKYGDKYDWCFKNSRETTID